MAQAGDNSKTALVQELNGLLADHLALYFKTKNFHWHVKGPRFRDLHLLFDEQAIELRDQIDEDFWVARRDPQQSFRVRNVRIFAEGIKIVRHQKLRANIIHLRCVQLTW